MKKKVFTFILLLFLTASLCGCRYSAAIEKVVLDRLRAEEIIEDEQMLDNEPEAETENESIPDIQEETEAEREDEHKEEAPVYDEEPESIPETRPSGQVTYNDANFVTDEPAKSSNTNTSPQSDIPNGTDTIKEQESESKEPESREAGSQPEEPSTEPENGSSDEPESSPGQGGDPSEEINDDNQGEGGQEGGSRTIRKVYGLNGIEQEVPENVDTVAAVGDGAMAVLMLAGSECLAATSSSISSGIFSAESIFPGLGSVPVLWDGTGGSGIGSSDFARLIEIRPDVVFEVSGQATITEAQAQELINNDIYYVTLPNVTSITSAREMVRIVGEVLGDRTERGGANAPQIAAAYSSWIDTEASAAYTGDAYQNRYFTLYVDDWDPDAIYEVGGILKGNGAAVIQTYLGANFSAISGFLSLANVVNVTFASSFAGTRKVYYTPFNYNRASVNVIGRYELLKTDILGNVASGATVEMPDPDDPEYTIKVAADTLGNGNFTTIIAGNNLTKEGLESNELWQAYPLTEGEIIYYGFAGSDGLPNVTNIGEGTEFDVVVNPCGLCRWSEPGVESILETVWAAYAITGKYSEDTVREKIQDFYSTFYHYDLSSAEISMILEGE